MRVQLRKVGNSRGVIIPVPFLVDCGFEGEVELYQVGKKLIIEAVNEPRANWFANYQPESEVLDDAFAGIASDEGIEEWEW
mgnify:CR=1 FL=1